jgi:uncharacterized protein YdeI (YjbR/CyaY-like superfamily)
MNPKVDEFISNAKKWQEELKQLRTIVLDSGLTEEVKWKVPCYTSQGKNIVIIHGFKEYCALLFFKGALLKDTDGLLIQQTNNVQEGRQIRFTNVQEIIDLKDVLKKYINEAIEVEKSGLKVDLKTTKDFNTPDELTTKFAELPAFKEAFDALTQGRQRAYLLHFSEPKQAKTRESRIEKCMPRIFNGKGLNDCVCGLSQKMPGCDGSHKNV